MANLNIVMRLMCLHVLCAQRAFLHYGRGVCALLLLNIYYICSLQFHTLLHAAGSAHSVHIYFPRTIEQRLLSFEGYHGQEWFVIIIVYLIIFYSLFNVTCHVFIQNHDFYHTLSYSSFSPNFAALWFWYLDFYYFVI
jgi:hypothetical protein